MLSAKYFEINEDETFSRTFADVYDFLELTFPDITFSDSQVSEVLKRLNDDDHVKTLIAQKLEFFARNVIDET